MRFRDSTFAAVLIGVLSLVCFEGCSEKCSTNRDCEGSEAERAASEYKCPTSEVFCLAGTCTSDCAALCEVERSDTNPCERGICTPYTTGWSATVGESYCTMLPIPCKDDSACPKYLPPTKDGSQAEWKCVKGLCKYPDYEYPTR